MKASEKYKRIFGKLESLGEPVPWTTGLSNMLEWLTWSTNDVLGITKTRYRKLIIELCHDPVSQSDSLDEKERRVNAALDLMMASSERADRYDKPASSVASPREALRRAKYFSEDYLNKEFDIFWGLVSDTYLDRFYGQLFDVEPGGTWYCHGNSGLFATSTGIRSMQMDNLSYNPERSLLVANELKLGGKKNPDQILKYALMYQELRERSFISSDTRLVLCFIGDRHESLDWHALIDAELAHCLASPKSTAKAASRPACIESARSATFVSTTWSDLKTFNEAFLGSLDPRSQQVEMKLLQGFNQSLETKAFLQVKA